MTPNEQPTEAPQQAPQQTPYEQQPVQQQYFAQPQQQPVQYVVMAESLKGVKGWLMFWVIIFGLSGLGYTSIFFTSMGSSLDGTGVISMVFAPILAVLSITTVVLIAMEKKLGKLMALGTIGAMAPYAVISSLVQRSSSDGPAAMVGAIMVALVLYGLWALYFVVSKRVKETLVK